MTENERFLFVLPDLKSSELTRQATRSAMKGTMILQVEILQVFSTQLDMMK